MSHASHVGNFLKQVYRQLQDADTVVSQLSASEASALLPVAKLIHEWSKNLLLTIEERQGRAIYVANYVEAEKKQITD